LETIFPANHLSGCSCTYLRNEVISRHSDKS